MPVEETTQETIDNTTQEEVTQETTQEMVQESIDITMLSDSITMGFYGSSALVGLLVGILIAFISKEMFANV